MKKTIIHFVNIITLLSIIDSDRNYPDIILYKLNIYAMINFLSIILLIFGVLQIILFFKMWGMTNDVNKIKKKLETQPEMKDEIISEAQIKTLNGEYEEAFKLYQKAFYKNVIELFGNTIKEYGDEHNMKYKERNEYYQLRYNKLVKFYSKRINKIGMEFSAEKFDSYEKIYSFICNS